MNRAKLYFLMIGLTLFASAGSAIAQQENPGIALAENLLYETGFERPVFMPGKLDGQGGWMNPGDSASILPVNPWEEKQSIRVAGNKLSANDEGDLVRTRFGPFFLYDTEANQTPIVQVSVYAQLQGPSTDTGHGPEDDLISANLDLFLAEFDENGDLKSIFIGALLLSSSGHVWLLDGEEVYIDSVPVDLDEYHSLRAQIDFDGRIVSFWVDDIFLAKVEIDASITTNIFATGALSMFAINDRNVVKPNKYKAYFDNYSVTAE